jgi:hypothetical protein
MLHFLLCRFFLKCTTACSLGVYSHKLCSLCFHGHLYIGCIFPSLFHHQICLMITTYCLCLTAPMDKGKFLMAARRFRRGPHTEYIISLDAEDLSQGSNAYMGKLRWGRSYPVPSMFILYPAYKSVGESDCWGLRMQLGVTHTSCI